MKSTSSVLRNALRNSHTLKAVPKVIFEWNQNRYAGIKRVDNDPSDSFVGYDIENFPISSIVDPQRPARGIIKARTSPSNIPTSGTWTTVGEEGFTSRGYTDVPFVRRYYTVGESSPYKYWCSPAPSLFSSSGGSFGFPSNMQVRPFVTYSSQARVNKIVVVFESSWSRPTDYDIQITNDGGRSWDTIAQDIAPDTRGRVIIYRQDNGLWSQTVNRDSIMSIDGIRLVIRGINRPDSFFNLIELSPRLEVDMSEYVISYDTEMSMAERSFITPIGQASSNMASLTLANYDGLLNNNNQSSDFYQIIDKNIKVTIDLEYDLSDFGASPERVREATMYVDEWSEQDALEMTASLKDSSKFLQEQKVPEILLENVTVGEAIWRLCDSIGFTNYVYDKKDVDPATALEYFWTDDEDTVWDAMQALAHATQTAIYFDHDDVLQIKTRDAAYDESAPVAWNLDATNNNGKLADIVEANVTAEYEANIVNINYKTTKISDDNKGLPEMQVLWQPEDAFVLRASKLIQPLTSTATVLRMNSKDSAVWPYEGLMNIEGEIIRYRGKEYQYYNKSGTITTAWVYSAEEKTNIDRSLTDLNQAFKSTWTGRLKIEERGAMWSSPRNHTLDLGGWSGRTVPRNGLTTSRYQGGIFHDVTNSLMRVTAPSVFGADSLYTVTRGQPSDANFRRYGTRVRIPNIGSNRGGCGIVINSGDYDSGYYIELVRTRTLDELGGRQRKFINEVSFFARHPNGTHHRLAGKGATHFITGDTWYDLDVDFYLEASGAHNITVYLNGIVMQRIRLTSGRVTPSGRCGVYQRGLGRAEFEYFFAHAGGEEYHSDDVSQFDKIRGGFVSGQWDREYVYSTRNATRKIGRNNVQYKQKYNQYYFDEFGPICHEIREMDVQFEKYPVLHSRLYTTNDSQILTPEYNSTPFGATFLLANASRSNAVGNGEDTLRYGPDNPITQKMMIYGRLIYQEEGQVYTVENRSGVEESPFQDENSIRRRGRIEIDFDNKWIQSKAAAKSLGSWIMKHWSEGNEEVQVEIFGNPLFAIGDLVSINYPHKNMYQNTHRYFVVSISSDYSEGLSTTLTLRRLRL